MLESYYPLYIDEKVPANERYVKWVGCLIIKLVPLTDVKNKSNISLVYCRPFIGPLRNIKRETQTSAGQPPFCLPLRHSSKIYSTNINH